MSRPFCVAIICPAHSVVECLPNGHTAATQLTTFLTVSYVVKSVYLAGDDSPRRPSLLDTTPYNISLHYHSSSPSNLSALPWGNHVAKNISGRHLSCLCQPCIILNC